jgi:glycosyltransferase involved in cell wall biosynthesis
MKSGKTIGVDNTTVFLMISQLAAAGGAERQVLYFASQLHQAGIPVTILSRNIDWEHVGAFGIPVEVRQGGVGHILTSGECTVVSFLAGDHARAAFAKLLRPSTIRWIPFERTHPNYYWLSRAGFRGFVMWIKRNFLRLGYRFVASSLICQTQSAAMKWRKLLGQSHKRVISVVPNHYMMPNVTATHSHLEARPFQIGMVGRLTEIKDYPFALRVAAQLMLSGVDFQLHIIGAGELEVDLKAESRRLGVSEKVVFRGMVRGAGNALSEFDLFMMTSLVEGMPNSLGEAMAAGLPCVVLDFEAGPRDLIGSDTEESRCQIVFARDEREFAERVRILADDLDLRKTLGEYNRKRIQDAFTKDVVSASFIEALHVP